MREHGHSRQTSRNFCTPSRRRSGSSFWGFSITTETPSGEFVRTVATAPVAKPKKGAKKRRLSSTCGPLFVGAAVALPTNC